MKIMKTDKKIKKQQKKALKLMSEAAKDKSQPWDRPPGFDFDDNEESVHRNNTKQNVGSNVNKDLIEFCGDCDLYNECNGDYGECMIQKNRSRKTPACELMQKLNVCRSENERLRKALAEAIGHLRFEYDCDLYSGSHVHDCKNCQQNENPPGCDAKPILDKLWGSLKEGRDG